MTKPLVTTTTTSAASFGTASTEGPERDELMTLLQCADKALYWAKEAGRNRVKIYVPSADPGARRAG